MRRSIRSAVSLSSLVALVATPLAAVGLSTPAAAAPSTGVVISEVFGGNGATNLYNQDYVELTNSSASSVDVTGWSVQYRSATSASGASSKVDLTGVIPAGRSVLVGGGISTCTPACTNTIPTPDFTNTGMNLSGTAGVVILSNEATLLTNAVIGAGDVRNNAKIVDLVGFGSTANVYENAATTEAGPAPAPSTSTTLQRTAADADDNSAEFTASAPGTPTNSVVVGPVPLDATDPGDKTVYVNQAMTPFTLEVTGGKAPYSWTATGTPAGVTVGADGTVSGTPTELGTSTITATVTDDADETDQVTFDITVTNPPALEATPVTGNRNGIEGVSIRPFTLTATGGVPPYSWSATGLPDGVTISPTTGEVTGTPTESGDFEVTATVTDGADPAGSSSVTFTLVVAPVLDRTIAEIQGTTDVSPYSGPEPGDTGADYVRTQGVITASYPTGGTGNLGGFFMQTSGAPETPDASDGIFVFMGSSASPANYPVGESVEVTGLVSERFGQTQIGSNAFQVAELATALPAPVLATSVPGSECTLGECPDASTLAELREAHEGEAFDLSGSDHTVTDSYSGGVGSSQMRGEFGIALNSTEPLVIPVEEVRPSDAEGLAVRKAYNAARGIVLDDGATQTYGASPAYPWLTLTNTVRAGAAAEFKRPVVLAWGFEAWRLQPESRIPSGDDGRTWVEFEQDRPAAPDDVLKTEGNLKIATFNMLNYFVHPAEEWVANGGDAVPGTERKCTYYTGGGERITARECSWVDPRTDPPSALGDPGPRGAATAVSLSRQQVKEVAAINTMDADIVSLEEVENPVKLGYSDRDLPLKTLVDALNAAWDQADIAANGPRWAYVASPRPEAQPTIAEQDAIRNAFIYNPRSVETVGRSRIAVNDPAFRNAREPLAQAFRHVDGMGAQDAFLVITNHFKSKGGPDVEDGVDPKSVVSAVDNHDTGNGAGWYNGDRVRQARALDSFAQSVMEDTGIDATFLAGDFNAYSKEDPVTTLNGRGWNLLEAENGETSYFFGGLAGSLDHVFANAAALAMVQGTTVWPINANEPVYYEYSRYKYNAAELYDQSAFRSSDHNPEIVGIKAPTNGAPSQVETVQVLASNDFHGRLLDDPSSAAAGAAAMAEAVKSLRLANPNTVFSMAGDIVGASTFESFIQNDKPTIDAMNEAGLEVSAAGNHEFDQGYDDLMDRIMSDTHAEGGAEWPYIAANVRDAATGDYALETGREDGHFANSNGATWWKHFADVGDEDGVRVGFVGAVTEDLDSLVAPDAIEGLAITSIVQEVNDAAAVLKTDGCGGEPCDLVVELVHEGAPSPSCATIKEDDASTFGRIVHEASDDIDAIVSGHTHLKYNCKVAVAGKELPRPVVSAGQYGSYLNRLQFDFEPGTDTLVNIRQHVLAMKDFDEDAETKAIVDAAVAVAETRGAVELGEIAGPFKRARRIDPTTPGSPVVENRGGESTLGNMVAEIQRWKTGADIGVMNPGGLRDDLLGTGDAAGPVTYREAANVQPFANTLVTVDLTGAQVKELLEEQWQRDPDGNVPSRPFLRLGTSKGFTWTEDASRAEGDRITGMWLDGEQVDPQATYTVSANSFIATGGDNFRALTLGTNRQDTGFTDLQATVEYLDEFASAEPLAVDYAQHAVGAKVAGGPFAAGDTVTVEVDSLSMTGGSLSSQAIEDVVDTEVTVTHGGTELGTFPVTTALPTTPYDVPGASTVSFEVPAGLAGGVEWFTITGDATGTQVRVPVNAVDSRAESDITVSGLTRPYGVASQAVATVTPAGATGDLTVTLGATTLGTFPLQDGSASLALPASLPAGTYPVTLAYSGDANRKPVTKNVTVTITKAATTVSGTDTTIQWARSATVPVTVTPAAAAGTVELYDGTTKLGEATLSGGSASIPVAAKALAVGSHTLVVKYAGSANHAASEGTVAVTVTKARPKVVLAKPKVKAGNKVVVKVAVRTDGYVATGKVRIVVQKAGTKRKVKVVGKLRNGKLGARISVRTRGKHVVRVTYLGDASTTRGSDRANVRVR